MKSISVSAASVSYITLKLNVNDDRFSSVLLNISNKMSNCSPAVLNNNTLTVTCTNLEAMTVYTVEGYTRAGNIYGSPYKQSVNTGKEDTGIQIRISLLTFF